MFIPSHHFPPSPPPFALGAAAKNGLGSIGGLPASASDKAFGCLNALGNLVSLVFPPPFILFIFHCSVL